MTTRVTSGWWLLSATRTRRHERAVDRRLRRRLRRHVRKVEHQPARTVLALGDAGRREVAVADERDGRRARGLAGLDALDDRCRAARRTRDSVRCSCLDSGGRLGGRLRLRRSAAGSQQRTPGPVVPGGADAAGFGAAADVRRGGRALQLDANRVAGAADDVLRRLRERDVHACERAAIDGRAPVPAARRRSRPGGRRRRARPTRSRSACRRRATRRRAG